MIEILKLAIILTIVDFIWLFTISNYFSKMIFKIQGGRKMKFDFVSAFLSYLVLVLSLYYFIIKEGKSPWDAALLGWSIYAVYETTNKATIKDWKWPMVILDTMWGGILFALTTFLYNFFKKTFPMI